MSRYLEKEQVRNWMIENLKGGEHAFERMDEEVDGVSAIPLPFLKDKIYRAKMHDDRDDQRILSNLLNEWAESETYDD